MSTVWIRNEMNNGHKTIRKYIILFSLIMIFVLFQVKAVTVQLDDLVSRIKLEQKSYGKLNEPIAISFFSATDDIQQSTMGLNGEFIHYLLLINVLLRMKTVESDKEKLVHLFQTTPPYNEDDETIDEFDQNYSPDKALWWYTRHAFVYQLLNECLRTQDIDRLFLFRFFIRDIDEQLSNVSNIYKN